VKVLIPRHSEVYGRVHSEARNGTELHGKISFTKKPAPANRTESMFSYVKCIETEFREFAFIFIPQTRNFELFFFPGMVRNRIPSVCFYLCTTERNPRVCFYFCSRDRILSIFLLCGRVRNGIPRVFCSVKLSELCRNKPIVLSIPSFAE
jgi:hypothetical protein